MSEQPRRSRTGVGRLLKLAWVRIVGWGSTISDFAHYVTGKVRHGFGAWWQRVGYKAVARGLARLAAFVILCVMALGIVNYTYRIYSFRQPFGEPHLEQETSLDFGTKLSWEVTDEGTEDQPMGVIGQSPHRLSLGPSVTELFPVSTDAPDPGIEVIAPSLDSREQSPAEMDVGSPRISVNPANMIWPAQGQVTIGYGWVRHPIYRDWRFHPGIELSTAVNAPVFAVMDGRIQQVQSERVQGLIVTIAHGDGWQTIYRGLSQLRVGEGEVVKRGQTIGLAGASEASQNGRVVFELRQKDTPLEPRMYLP